MQSWTGKWYITDSNGNKQPLAQGNGANGSWSDGGKSYNGWSLVNNELSCSSTNNTNGWYFTQQVGNLTVYAPNGETLGDYLGYRVVFEVSDANPVDEPKVRFILPIPTGVVFEYDGTILNGTTSVTQTLPSRSATEVTLDWTNNTATATMNTTGVKYARFFVVDSNDDPVDATDNAHRLTITGATATLCTNPASGYYVYPGSNADIDFSSLSVKLSSTGNLSDYKVVCWLATSTTNIAFDGTSVTEEPDITNEYVYSFTKPAPTTVDKTGTIAWGASMQADASDGAPADWGTTWAELSQEQRVVWYVTNGTTKQALVIGTAAQANSWTLNLPNVFSVSSNEAVLTGQTSFTATEWATWGKPTIYAPTGTAYAEAHGYQVVCEVYESATGTTPNVRYTFSFTKDFLGELKSGVTATTVPVLLADATAVSYELTGITLPTGAKYARFYLTDGTGTPVDPTDKLTVGGTPGTVSGHAEYGYYIYNESGIASTPTVTLTLTDATLNQYKVVMVTSADNAVTESGAVVNEPDWDTQTTWSFKYPVQHTEKTGTVEWSPVSMTVPLDIDTHKGSGYLASLGTDYHVVWTVSVGGTETTPATGNARQSGQWTMSLDGNNATFYAPTGQTFADMSNVTFVARLYETATGENDTDKSLTYTVSIVKTGFFGELKDPTQTGSTTVALTEESTTPVLVPLSNATEAFTTATYARVWLTTTDGTMVDPTGKLALPTGMTAFGTNHSATYGYYIYDANGISLSDADLTLAARADYPQYQVHIALSADAPVGIGDFARADAPLHATSLTAWEPDYDYEYTISFSYQDNSMKVIKIYEQASEVAGQNGQEGHGENYATSFHSQVLQELANMNKPLDVDNSFVRWNVSYNGNSVPLGQNNQPAGGVQLRGDYGANFHLVNDNKTVYLYKTESWDNTAVENKLKSTIIFANGVYQLGTVVECWVTNVNSHSPVDPTDGYLVKVEIHFNDDGLAPDDFPGTFSGTETTFTHEMALTEKSTQITLIPATTSAKYARYYLVKDGVIQQNSSSVISLASGNGQSSTERAKRGVYVYNSEGLSANDLRVTVTLPAGTFEDYQLVALFSDEAPEQSGSTITKEPEVLDEKQVHTFSYPTETIDKYIKWDTNSTTINLASILATDLPSLTNTSTTGYIGWSVYDGPYGSGTRVNILPHRNSSDLWSFRSSGSNPGVLPGYNGGEGGQGTLSISGAQITGNLNSFATPLVNAPGNNLFEAYKEYVIVAEVSDVSSDKIRVRYIFHFTDDGLAPDEFPGTFSGTASEHTHEMVLSETSTQITFTPTTTGAKYVRYYLLKNGEEQATNSTTNITVAGNNGTTSAERPKRGVYFYNASGLTEEDLTVTVSLPVGSYEDYQLVAVFSDEAPAFDTDGTTIIKEPSPLDEQQVYSFQYTTETIHKYVKWNTNQVHIGLDNLATVLPTLTSTSTTGYIGWSVYDGPYETGSQVVITSTHYNTTDKFAFSSNGQAAFGPYDPNANPPTIASDATVLSISDTQIQTYFSSFTNPFVNAPGTSKFEEYKKYVIVAEVSDVSSEKIRVRYIFHFTEDGEPPFTFLNETDPVTTVKKMTDVNDFADANNVLTLSEGDFTALASGAKYVRVYLEKYGSAQAASSNIEITYNGSSDNVQTCDVARYGKYLTVSDGIDLSKLQVKVNNLSADEMLKYNVIIVSADGVPTAEQEPAWDKKAVYSFQQVIRERIYADDKNYIDAINKQSDILSRLGAASVADFSKSLYAKWYIENPAGEKQVIGSGNGSWDYKWYFEIINSGIGNWQKDNDDDAAVKNLLFYTGQDDNSTSANIEGNGWNIWQNQIALTTKIHVSQTENPPTATTMTYVGWKVVFEISDEYDTATGTEPDYRLRYVFTITDPSAFTGDAKSNAAEVEYEQTVTPRSSASVTVDLSQARNHAKLNGKDLKYARFYLVDAQGNMIDPDGMLTVTYGGDNAEVTTCNVAEHGFYIYPGDNGTIDQSQITVTLAAPNAYKLYKVVAVFSTDLAGAEPADGSTPLMREPDYDLKYTYSFDYPVTTVVIERTVEWSNTAIKPDASEEDIETEWGNTPGTSWEELSAGQYVKWYVVPTTTDIWGNVTGIQLNNKQQLVYGTSRQNNVWTIRPASAYTVDTDKDWAYLTGVSAFTEANWNSAWSKPQVYAPSNLNWWQVINGYRIICDITAENDENATPIVRYVFSIERFFGDLASNGHENDETIDVDRDATSVTVPLQNAFSEYPGPATPSGIVYARVWLTTTDGTPVTTATNLVWNQDGKQNFPNNTDWYGSLIEDRTKYGYYWHPRTWNPGPWGGGQWVATGINSLTDATLTLPEGSFSNYQVHVALSTDEPQYLGDQFSEPDYDFHYIFNFDYGFEAKNINTVKTKYKTVIIDDKNQFTPHLFQNWPEVAADCDVTRDELVEKGYARWYLQTAGGELIQIEELISNKPYTSLNNLYGYYRYKFDTNSFGDQRGLGNGDYNPTITLPNGYDYHDVRLVCVVTTKTEPQLDDENQPTGEPYDMPACEPVEMQVKYVYNLMKLSDFTDRPFIHYQGEAYKYLMQMGMTDMAAQRDYIKLDATTDVQEQSWDYENLQAVNVAENIRQNVHTVDYYVYFDPANATDKQLMLPAQYYFGGGNDTEPRAYFRWYDYETDKTASCLTPYNDSGKSELHETSDHRGYIAMLLNSTLGHPREELVGVRFNAPAGWDASSEEILVACDVSRYLDGLDDSFQYLVHEPTLSERYLFHILPAQKIANDIADAAQDLTGGSATGLAAVEANLKAGIETPLYENNGRTVVSLNGTTGTFSMRANLQQLSSYWVWTDANRTNLLNVPQMQWLAYYRDADGTLWKHTVDMGYSRATSRLGLYQLSDFAGTYSEVDGNGTKNISANDLLGDRLYMVGCMGDGRWTPVIWTEMNFIDARPLELGTEGTVPERTDPYMRSEYTLAQVLDFNEFFIDEDTRFNKPTTAYENYAKVPIIWPDAQYGFCYPQLYGLCGTNKFAGWGVYGISPTHGDYTLLKSMNATNAASGVNVSKDEDFFNQSIGAQWWSDGIIYDVTHERAANGKNYSDTNDYGTFLYVDASDEARVIAELEFDAALCENAEIYYTAYVADITNGATKPQVRFRVYTYNTTTGYPVGTVVNGETTALLPDETAQVSIPVVSFETGNICSEGAEAYVGKWYQVYGYTTLPQTDLLSGTSRHYYVSVENSCEDTNGADYCVDQISFYTHQAKVKAKIVSDICDDGPVRVKIYAEAEQLLKSLRALSSPDAVTKDVFFCIAERFADLNHELHAEDIVTGNGIYTDQNGNPNNEYGVVSVPLNVNLENITNTALPEGATSGFYYDAKEDMVYFQFDDREFELEPGKKYFVSIYDIAENRVGSLTGWGTPYNGNACTVYSNDLSPNRMYIDLSVDGQASDGHIEFGCNVSTVTKVFDLAVNYPSGNGYERYSYFYYDFYKGTKADFNDIHDANDLYLSAALEGLRKKVNTAISTSYDLPTEYDDEYTKAMHDLIKTYMDSGALLLLASNRLERTFDTAGVETYAAIPLTKEVTTGGYICSPIEFSFNVDASYGGPEILLGFDDVDYPDGYIRVVRAGLEQLSKMIEKPEGRSNYMLHIPISSYHNKGQGMNGRIYFSDTVLNLVNTNDPSITTDNNGVPTTTIKVGEIKLPEEISSGRAYVGPDRMYLPVDFSGCEITFHEGYSYEVSTSFYDEEDETLDATQRCGGDLFFILKVVPEFATWQSTEIMSHDQGEETPTGFFNANWYQDANWQRSVRADLYKDAVDTRNQNTATLGHPNGYSDDTEIDAAMTGNPGFVPMKFTYVTILGGNHAPSLIKEPKVSTSSSQQGGGLLDPNLTRMLTDPSPYSNQLSSEPTENIRYDMLVRYGAHSEGGEGCFGHRMMSMNQAGKYIWGNDPRSEEQMTQFNTDRKAFDVEKFYGNICKEIYFKPGAELLRQQRLSYNRAWVEKEVNANKWYLVSSPLKDTYAGDMYVPVTMSDLSMDTPTDKAGRQMTEAFQPISFNTAAVNADADHTVTSQPAYSRTKYPIYQRSWNNDGAKVYTKTTDARQTDYSANLVYDKVTTVDMEWSHTYNDVQVPYTTLTGFSIRPHKKDQTDNTLIRLPKADTEYDYYQWDNTSPADGKLTHSVARTTTPRTSYPLPSRYPSGITDNYRLVVDDPEADGLLTVNISDLQQQDGYILVGNPHMASLRMDEFFRLNPGLASSYWTYEGSVPSAALAAPEAITATGNDNADGIIRPLQAFFVKKKAELAEGETEATTITFTRSMTIDGNFPALPSAGDGGGSRQTGLMLSARSEAGGSSAKVLLSDEASDDYREGEDVETLFDSNLADVPMVYTVADGGQAVSIDQRPQLDIVSFGVVQAKNEPVEVQVTSHLSPLTSDLYFIDALTGEQTSVTDGTTLTVQPNDYGRYFLSTTSVQSMTAKEQGIIISVRQQEVTVTANSGQLNTVRATTLNGVAAYSSDAGLGSQCHFQLPKGVYIIQARTEDGFRRQMKVVVK